MTHDHSALLARLDSLKGADVASMFAELIQTGPQELIAKPSPSRLSAQAATNAPRTATAAYSREDLLDRPDVHL